MPPYSMILTVIWPFGSNFDSFLCATIINELNTNIKQESSIASDFQFPCKPLLGPSPELMQPQPSLRVVQGSIVWRQRMRGVCLRWKWEVLGRRGLSETIFTLAMPAWHRTIHRTVLYRLDGKVRSPKYANAPYFKKIRSVPPVSYRTVPSDRTCTTLVT